MALGKRKTSPQPQPQRRGHVPPLPHPSWRMNVAGADAGGTVQIVQARDFWDRLGL